MGVRTQVTLRNALLKMQPHLLQARDQNLNEADTVIRVVKVFENVLGYDALSEISRELQMRDKFLDLVIKIDDIVKLIVEVKAAGVTLRDRHIEQAYNYASRNNFRWVVLTNGVVWNLYHLTFEEGVEYECAFSVDLSKGDINVAAENLAILHRESIKSDGLEEFWERKSALSPISIGRSLFHEEVLKAIRREVRRDAGILIDSEDLASAIREMLSQEVREQIGPLKVRKRRQSRVPKTPSECGKNSSTSPVSAGEVPLIPTEGMPDKT